MGIFPINLGDGPCQHNRVGVVVLDLKRMMRKGGQHPEQQRSG
jgi:hypothetical protein